MLVQQYQGPLNSARNYSLWFALVDTFTGRTTFDYLTATIKTEEAVFLDVNALTNFLDNHDNRGWRVKLERISFEKRMPLHSLMFTSGIPFRYFEFEQRFNSSADPVNREPMWTSGYNTNATLYQYVAKLHEVRPHTSAITCKTPYFSSIVKVLGTSSEYMSLQRGPLVVVSNVGASGTPAGFEIIESNFSPGTTIFGLISCATVRVGHAGGFVSPPNDGEARTSGFLLST